MKKFVILRTDYPMEVHAEGCADLNRKRLDTGWRIYGDNVADAVAKETAVMNQEFDHEYKEEELFRIMPCAQKVTR